MPITFTIPGPVKGKGRPRVTMQGGFARAYTPKDTANYENLVKVMYMQEAKGKAWMDKEPLKMIIIALQEIPKSASKKQANLMRTDMIRPTKKPDADNIAKIICDGLNGVAYHDDTQIVELNVFKHYSDTPGVTVTIEEVTGNDTEGNGC